MLVAGCAERYEQPSVRPVRTILSYDQPLVSPGAQFSGLPPAVQNTVRAQAGSAEIVALMKETNANLVVYKFHFRNSDVNPPLMVSSDGSVLNPDFSVAVGAPTDTIGVGTGAAVQGLKLSDLPQNVMKTIQERAPKAEVASIRKEARGDNFIYIISFKDETNPELRVNPDGSVFVEVEED